MKNKTNTIETILNSYRELYRSLHPTIDWTKAANPTIPEANLEAFLSQALQKVKEDTIEEVEQAFIGQLPAFTKPGSKMRDCVIFAAQTLSKVKSKLKSSKIPSEEIDPKTLKKFTDVAKKYNDELSSEPDYNRAIYILMRSKEELK